MKRSNPPASESHPESRTHGAPVHARLAREADLPALVLAAEGTGPDKDKVIGVVRAAIRERPFYMPETEGVILDIYLLPLYRRHGAGHYLVEHTIAQLKERGAGIVTVEFPAQNEIASRFYAKCGFRPITAHHARIV